MKVFAVYGPHLQTWKNKISITLSFPMWCFIVQITWRATTRRARYPWCTWNLLVPSAPSEANMPSKRVLRTSSPNLWHPEVWNSYVACNMRRRQTTQSSWRRYQLESGCVRYDAQMVCMCVGESHALRSEVLLSLNHDNLFSYSFCILSTLGSFKQFLKWTPKMEFATNLVPYFILSAKCGVGFAVL